MALPDSLVVPGVPPRRLTVPTPAPAARTAPPPGVGAPAARSAPSGEPRRPDGVARASVLLTPAVTLANLAAYALAVVGARALGTGGYGALGSLLGLLTVTSVPGLALQLVIARRTAAGEPLSTRAVVRHGLVVGAVAAAVIGLATPLLGGFLHLHPPEAVLWLALGLVPAGVSAAVQGSLQGSHRVGRLSAVVAAAGLGKLAGGGIVLAAGGGAPAAIAGVSAGALAAAVVAVLLLAGHQGSRSAAGAPHQVTDTRLGGLELTHAGVGLGLLLLLTSLDLLLARHQLGAHAAGVYAAASVLSKGAFWLPQAIPLMALPRLTSGHPDRRRTLLVSLALCAGCALAVTAGAALLGGPVLRLAFGSAYASAGSWCWLFAAQGGALALTQLSLYAGLATGLRSTLLGVMAGAAIAETGLVFGLGLHTGRSLVTAAALTAVTMAAVCCVLVLRSVRVPASAGAGPARAS